MLTWNQTPSYLTRLSLHLQTVIEHEEKEKKNLLAGHKNENVLSTEYARPSWHGRDAGHLSFTTIQISVKVRMYSSQSSDLNSKLLMAENLCLTKFIHLRIPITH